MSNSRCTFVPDQADTWAQTTIVGADHIDIPAHVAFGVRGDDIVAWARFTPPGMTAPITIHARTNLRAIEEALGRQIDMPGALERYGLGAEDDDDTDDDLEWAIGGKKARRKARRLRRRKRIFGKIKAAAKKIGKSKVFKGIARVAKKIVNNPLVKGVLAVVPGGQAVLAAQTAAKIVKRAAKGSKKARGAIKRLRTSYRQGNPKAGAMLKIMRKAVEQQRRFARLSGDDMSTLRTLPDPLAFEVIMGECLGQVYTGDIGIGAEVIMGDEEEAAREIDAIATFADESQFAPLRWALLRLGPQYDAGSPAVSARDALTEGHAAMGNRFRRVGPGQPWDVKGPDGARYARAAA